MPKISELPAAEAFADGDEFPANQQGVTRKVTGSRLAERFAPAIAALIDAADADFTYSLITHGEPFTVFADAQTVTRTWTFGIAEGTDGKARGLLVNSSPSESVTVRLEDVTSPTSFLPITLPAEHMARIIKRSDGQWLIPGIAPRNIGTLATKDAVDVGAGEVVGVAQWRLVGNTEADTQARPINPSALTEEAAPASGDWVILQKAVGGQFRKVQNVNLGSAATSPSVVTTTAATHPLTDAQRRHPENVTLVAEAATDIEVPTDATAGDVWIVHVATGGTVTVSVNTDVGSVNDTAGGSVTAAGNLSTLEITVVDNPGSAPVVKVERETAEVRVLAADLDGNSQRIFKYRQKKSNNLSGAQTLSAANFDSGSTLAHSGAAATYTVPSRVASADTDATEQLVIHNRGSGAITLSASGVTIKGDTSIAIDASATLEWEHDGTTEFVWVRSTG